MNIIVCIKQVPGTKAVDIDPKTGVLKRSGVRSKMNPYDLYSLEAALRLKEETGGRVTAVTMGPPQAADVIREAYMMGADDGYIMSDIKFAGSDVLATSYTLAAGIRTIGDYDLVICGKQTTDGDTAQVGPAVAEHLGIPHVTWVSKIESITEKEIIVEQNMEDSLEVVSLGFPCLISVEKDLYTPRLPSYLNMQKTKDREVKLIDFKGLMEKSDSNFGLSGSPTKVERVFQPVSDVEQTIWVDGEDECVKNLLGLLVNGKYI